MPDFVQLLEQWLNDQLMAEISKKNPRVALRSYLRFCAGRVPSRELLVKWMQDWSGSDGTMQGYASSMRRFFAWLGHEGLFPDIGHGLRNYTRKQFEHSRLPLTERQVDLLLAHLAEYDQPCRRDICMILLMINCGLRSCEVQRSLIGDIYQQDSRTFLSVQGKGHVYPDACVELMPHLAEQIKFYLSVRPGPKGKSNSIFYTLDTPVRPITANCLTRTFREHLNAVGLFGPRYTAHSLRHTAATIALSRGSSEEEVSKMLRHVDPRTTRIYTRYVNRMANPAERNLDFKLPDSTERKVIPISARSRP